MLTFDGYAVVHGPVFAPSPSWAILVRTSVVVRKVLEHVRCGCSASISLGDCPR
jgi:hypothetical protein